MFFFFHYFRLKTHEILSLLEEDEADGGDIILHVPEPEIDSITDEDSDKSDDEAEGNINHLGKKLLSTTCDFIPHNVDESTSVLESNSEIATVNKKSNKKSKITKEIEWLETVPVFDVNSSKPNLKRINEDILASSDELDLLKLFLTDDFIEHIMSQTNLYAQQKNETLNMSKSELWVVLGALLLSGYAKYPNKRLYWSRECDTPSILSDAMRCRRFEAILHHFHLNDNSKIDPNDRLYKLRPMLDHFSKKFLELSVLDEHLSIDESMIPYFGRHFAKQYIKGKPIRFGFKNWALCSSAGYMYAFDVYMGKSDSKSVESGLGVGGEIVKKLLRNAKVPKNAGYKVYFDNYFTSYSLLHYLSEEGMCATGTVRENRIPASPLPTKVEFNKKSKGSVEITSSKSVMVVKYKDNNVLTIASNFDSPDIGTTQRYSREKKKNIQHPQPVCVKNYNAHMGGVDLMDNMVACYRTRMRQKKWWWPIFVYFFDVAIVNAWLLWRKAKDNNCKLLDFRRKLAITILKIHGTPSSQGKQAPTPLKGVRYDGYGHWIETSNLRRCANCPGKATFSCTKCNVGLHPRCHKVYHTDKA